MLAEVVDDGPYSLGVGHRGPVDSVVKMYSRDPLMGEGEEDVHNRYDILTEEEAF